MNYFKKQSVFIPIQRLASQARSLNNRYQRDSVEEMEQKRVEELRSQVFDRSYERRRKISKIIENSPKRHRRDNSSPIANLSKMHNMYRSEALKIEEEKKGVLKEIRKRKDEIMDLISLGEGALDFPSAMKRELSDNIFSKADDQISAGRARKKKFDPKIDSQTGIKLKKFAFSSFGNTKGLMRQLAVKNDKNYFKKKLIEKRQRMRTERGVGGRERGLGGGSGMRRGALSSRRLGTDRSGSSEKEKGPKRRRAILMQPLLEDKGYLRFINKINKIEDNKGQVRLAQKILNFLNFLIFQKFHFGFK